VSAPATPELRPFGEQVWLVDGPKVRDFGILFTTCMVVMKLASGAIWVNSPMPAPFDLLKRMVEFGLV
jgi:hypothetical protein